MEPQPLAEGTLSSPKWLQDIAYFDPRLAWLMVSCGRGSCMAPFGWEIINIRGQWTSGEVDQVIVGNLSERLDSDIWVRKVVYTVRRPNAFAGSIWKAQSDEYNKLNPNIDFTMQIKSFCNYFIAEDDTPLENIGMVFECVCPAGLVLKCNSNITTRFINRRAFTDGENGELPVEAVISLHGITMPPNLYASCEVPAAVEGLQNLGILPR